LDLRFGEIAGLLQGKEKAAKAAFFWAQKIPSLTGGAADCDHTL
jgi:hypothetical protein